MLQYRRTDVKDTELASISIFCPHLEKLTLNLCGRLDDDVLNQWEKGFEELRHLNLYGTPIQRTTRAPCLREAGLTSSS